MGRWKYGVLLGAWFVANITAYRLLVNSGWPMVDAPSSLRVDVFRSLNPGVIALAVLVPIALVPLWLYLERITGIDQQRVAAASRWSVRALTTPASLIVIAIVMVLFVLPAIDERLWLAAIPAMLFVLLLPFGIFTTEVASSDAGDRWWIPKWPGVLPVVAVVLLFVLVIGIETGAAILARRIPALTALAITVTVVVGALALPLEASILLFRDARNIWSWRQLGPVIAVQARVLYGFLFVLAPIAVGALLVWRQIPASASWAEEHGAVLPWSARAFVTIADVLGTSGVFLASFTIGVVLMLMISRALWEARHPQ